MSDLRLTWGDDHGAADLTYEDGDLLRDDGLETAILLSLFTGSGEGWWGDEFPVVADDVFGSGLWEIARAVSIPSTLRRAQELAEAALAWLVTDGVASSVTVVVTGAAPILYYAITVARPQEAPAVYRYSYNWQAQELRHGIR
jgi:phage gp46-like protein